jgi:magnesium transporter
MNFEYMPELEMKYGYFFALGGMALIGLAMFAWFKYKGWLNLFKS